MKVFELIEKLQNCPKDATVVVLHEADWIDIEDVEHVECKELTYSTVELKVY
jgi:hypothetical protein